jgi:hypothetical protein
MYSVITEGVIQRRRSLCFLLALIGTLKFDGSMGYIELNVISATKVLTVQHITRSWLLQLL